MRRRTCLMGNSVTRRPYVLGLPQYVHTCGQPMLVSTAPKLSGGFWPSSRSRAGSVIRAASETSCARARADAVLPADLDAHVGQDSSGVGAEVLGRLDLLGGATEAHHVRLKSPDGLAELQAVLGLRVVQVGPGVVGGVGLAELADGGRPQRPAQLQVQRRGPRGPAREDTGPPGACPTAAACCTRPRRGRSADKRVIPSFPVPIPPRGFSICDFPFGKLRVPSNVEGRFSIERYAENFQLVLRSLGEAGLPNERRRRDCIW